MRTSVFFILLSIGKSLFGQTIDNPGFESKNLDQGKIASWATSISEETIISIDTLNYVEGRKSLKINGTSIGWIRQAIPFNSPVSKPTRIRFKAQIKTDLKKGYVKLLGRVVDNSGITNYQSMRSKKITGKTNWTEYSLDMIVDSLTKEIRVAGYFDGTGEAYFDDFKFTPISQLTTNTNTSQIKDYTKRYLQIIRDNALYKDSVNFSNIEKTVLELTRSASSVNDCLPILTYTLHRLKDGHSSLSPAEDVENAETDEYQSGIYPSFKLVDNIGYVSIPQFNASHEKTVQRFADSLQNGIKWLDELMVQGWIIDVRDNGGGNCWPMIAGIGPILGDGIHGYSVLRNGQKKSWSYFDGVAKEGNVIMMRSNFNLKLLNANRPIAVLINRLTASSAEVVAVLFMDLPNAELFGEPSAGKTTSNEEIKLDDGSVMYLCEGVYATRNMRLLGNKIQPDKYVPSIPDSEIDNILGAAIKWIKTK